MCVSTSGLHVLQKVCVCDLRNRENKERERESAAAGHQSPLTCGGWSVDSS